MDHTKSTELGGVMEQVIRGHLGSELVGTVTTRDASDNMIDVVIELTRDPSSSEKTKLFSLNRVLYEHLLAAGQDMFPVVNTTRSARIQ